MKLYRPSRMLNEGSKIMGLGIMDVLGLTVVFWFMQIILATFRLEIFALFIAAAMAAFLIRIRLKHRRGIVRDMVRFQFIRVMKQGVFRDGSL